MRSYIKGTVFERSGYKQIDVCGVIHFVKADSAIYKRYKERTKKANQRAT